MTSNGTPLARLAQALKTAGLDDLNISIDAINEARFAELAQDDLRQVLDGILAARVRGLALKLNVVIVRGRNESEISEILPLAEWALAQRMPLRYIEFMPLDARGDWSPQKVVPEKQIITALAGCFTIEPPTRTREPTTYYWLDGKYRIGVISTVSNPFCASCDRVRLAATGEFYPCLLSPLSANFKGPLRAGAADDELQELIRQTAWRKGKGFIASAGYAKRAMGMHAIGGQR